MYSISEIQEMMKAHAKLGKPHVFIQHLLIDSRRLLFPDTTLFFALKTSRRSGATFVDELYAKGVRNFVVPQTFDAGDFTDCNFLIVDDTTVALQALTAAHRQHFTYPVIGVTGSNGKTIVKEWLYHLLHHNYTITRSPKSYNSQVGVPLSIWQMDKQHSLAIIEAGISQVGEMQALANIIQPTIGIFTTLGEAHDAGFSSKEEKLKEKWHLFNTAEVIICNTDDDRIREIVLSSGKTICDWGLKADFLKITGLQSTSVGCTISAIHQGQSKHITIPFTDQASIDNAITCWCTLLHLGIADNLIEERMLSLQPVEMRLQLKKVMNNCLLINDSYSNDVSSLKIALDFLQQQSGTHTSTVILSDLGDNASNEAYEQILHSLVQHHVKKFIGIGPKLSALQNQFRQSLPKCYFFQSVEVFKEQFPFVQFKDEAILLKGARVFEFEQIDILFEQQVHQTVMEVNLTAMLHNLKQYQQYINPATKIMAMVKAFSYGSGSAEVASVLQFHKVDYLAVAYADEGVELRKAGISMPIMVMNAEQVTFPLLVQHNLEPEMYSFSIIKSFNEYLQQQGLEQYPVHIKLDTGMHRLGFEAPEIPALVEYLANNKRLVVKSVFSHLVGSEDPAHDNFTHQQVTLFKDACASIEQAVGYSIIKHIANSAAIFRHPQYQFDMVRLGIGLYGIDSAGERQLNLTPVATLRTTIAQIRTVKAGESVGYSRKGVVKHDSRIATIRIGYADGFSRMLGNGKAHVLIHNLPAPTVGNICMDMAMIDVTAIPNVKEGDMVEVFGPNLPVQKLAEWAQTIPYEIMTGISQRVKRVYYQE